MSTLRFILGDQLSLSISSLVGCNKSKDIILMTEVWNEATYVKHHKKKIAYLFSSMRHFAEELKYKGFKVEYIKLDDPNNTGFYIDEIRRALKRNQFDRIVITHPSDYRVLLELKKSEDNFIVPIEIIPDNRFLCSMKDFKDWASDRKQLRMEYFYREMRKKYSILMELGKPVGGKWNFDSENRKSPDDGLCVPKPYLNNLDSITQDVIKMVANIFSNHFGDLEPFYFAVNRDQALLSLNLFLEQRLSKFGDYQDAMIEGEPWMYHSHISVYLNSGLLLPLECVKHAEEVYNQGLAPLNSVEGFIRQIIGWREYVRGIYWLKMPKYAESNFLNAKRKLPNFYWTGNTKMNCLHQCVVETRANAYAHHIQRLMVLGNFALLAGIDPIEVNEWFLIVYADAYEWVELPNVSGMVLFADGGYLASKPYAAGGSYIKKMSNYCTNCSYMVSKKNGKDACPFNYLYWNFLAKNYEKLKDNHRMGMMYQLFNKMNMEKQKAIQDDSKSFLKKIDEDALV